MKYPAGIETNTMLIPITRICNRRCPECGARDELTWYNKSVVKKEMSLEEIKQIGGTLGRMDRLEISGGEPTLHTQFEELATNLKHYFQCDNIWLITAGWLFKRDPSKLNLLLNFQNVYMTHYTETFARTHGGATNTEELNLVANFLKNHPQTGFHPNCMDRHIPNIPKTNGKPCHLARIGFNSYFEGKIYGCCTAWSLPDKGVGIPLTSDWRSHLTEIELPCRTCYISN